MSRETERGKNLLKYGLGALGLAGVGYILYQRFSAPAVSDASEYPMEENETPKDGGGSETEEITEPIEIPPSAEEIARQREEEERLAALEAQREAEERQRREEAEREAEEKEREDQIAAAQAARTKSYQDEAKEINSMNEYRYTDGILTVKAVRATDVKKVDKKSESDPYLNLHMSGDSDRQKQRTKVVKDCKDPVWNQSFEFKVKNAVTDSLKVHLMDDNSFKDTEIAKFAIPVTLITSRNGFFKGSFDLRANHYDKESESYGRVDLEISYTEPPLDEE